jgi:TonB family protein
VERPQVVEAQPAGMFDNEVLAALSRWTYEPARYHGAPVKVAVTQTFRFD